MPAAAPPRPRTRKPTGKPPWPIVLLEGGEKVGKTWEAVTFSGDERIHRTFVLDLGEGCADEYGAIPGVDYEILEHDGTWRDIIAALEWAVAESETIAAAGQVPYLVVDTGTAEWDMLREWANQRGRRTRTNREKLAKDPDAEIKVPRNVWNDVDSRHAHFMRLVRQFRGPKTITARGKWVSATDPKTGQPVESQKEYRVEGQKNIGYDANAWVRLSREAPPTVIGLRGVRWGVRPGIDQVQPWPEFNLGRLIFDTIGCEPGTTTVHNQPDLNADQVLPGEEISLEDGEQTPGAPSTAPAPANQSGVRFMPNQVQAIRNGAPGWVRNLLAIDDLPAAEAAAARLAQHWSAPADMLPYLDTDMRERLGYDGPEVTYVPLTALADKVVALVKKHGRAVSAPLDETPAPAESVTEVDEKQRLRQQADEDAEYFRQLDQGEAS